MLYLSGPAQGLQPCESKNGNYRRLCSSGVDKAEDINLSDIDSECSCVESTNIVKNEMIEAIDGKKISDMSDEEKKAFKEKTKPLRDKAEEIEEHCDKKFPKTDYEEIKDCDAVEEFKKTMEKMKELR